MWFNELTKEEYENSIIAVAISYGKDSLAALHVLFDILKWRADLIYTTDMWFDDDTPMDLPEVWEFKQKMEELIFSRYGLKVQHFCAEREIATADISTEIGEKENTQTTQSDSLCNKEVGARNSNTKKLTYKEIFYRTLKPRERESTERIYGYPIINGEWCRSYLKTNQRIPNLNQSRELVYGTQDKCFLKAPRRGAVQISLLV